MFDPRVMRGSTFSQHNRDKLVVALQTIPGSEHSPEARKKLRWREKSIYDYRAPKSRPGDYDLTAHLVEKEKVVAVAVNETQVSP